MTVIQLIILPGILLGLFFLGITWIAWKLASGRLAVMKAQRAAAELPPALFRQQASVITDVICELEVNRLSYTAFPLELKDRLMEAHAAWENPEGKGITR